MKKKKKKRFAIQETPDRCYVLVMVVAAATADEHSVTHG
jgi:hypothetical protein